MRTQRGYRALDKPTPHEIGPDVCQQCGEPLPCGHVVVLDALGQDWVLTAREAAQRTTDAEEATEA